MVPSTKRGGDARNTSLDGGPITDGKENLRITYTNIDSFLSGILEVRYYLRGSTRLVQFA